MVATARLSRQRRGPVPDHVYYTYYVLNGDRDVVDTPIHMYLCAEVCSHPQLAHIHACNSRSPSSPSRADALELMKLR